MLLLAAIFGNFPFSFSFLVKRQTLPNLRPTKELGLEFHLILLFKKNTFLIRQFRLPSAQWLSRCRGAAAQRRGLSGAAFADDIVLLFVVLICLFSSRDLESSMEAAALRSGRGFEEEDDDDREFGKRESPFSHKGSRSLCDLFFFFSYSFCSLWNLNDEPRVSP